MLKTSNFVSPPAASSAQQASSGNLYVFEDDFQVGTSGTLTTAAAFTAAEQAGWTGSQIVGGTQTFAAQSGTFAHPGIIRLTTAAVSGQGFSIYRGAGAASAGPLGPVFANAGWVYDVWFRTGATITNYAIRLGFTRDTQFVVDGPSSGVWIEFDTANANSSAAFQIRSVSGGSSTYTTTGVSPSSSTWYHLRLAGVSSGVVSWSLGSAEGAMSAPANISSNVDTTNSMGIFVQVLPRTTSAVILELDRVAYSAPTTRG